MHLAKEKDSIKAHFAQQIKVKEETKRQQRISGLEDAIHELDVQMELLEEISLLGVEVTQEIYGVGSVVAQDGSRITIQFPEKTTSYIINKQFAMRPRHENDDEIVEVFTEFDKLKTQKSKLEKELERI